MTSTYSSSKLSKASQLLVHSQRSTSSFSKLVKIYRLLVQPLLGLHTPKWTVMNRVQTPAQSLLISRADSSTFMRSSYTHSMVVKTSRLFLKLRSTHSNSRISNSSQLLVPSQSPTSSFMQATIMRSTCSDFKRFIIYRWLLQTLWDQQAPKQPI